ncbi:thymidine kinase [Clostridium perfringens]
MFSEKSKELIRQGERHLLAKHKVVFFKPSIDNIYSNNEIVTHTGAAVKAIIVGPKESLLDHLDQDVNVVLIDEVQFFNKSILKDVWVMLKNGIDVYCSGLDMDYMGTGFNDTVIEIMAMAYEVNKLHAICEHCGVDAMYSAKRDFGIFHGLEKISLGTQKEYIPICIDYYVRFMESRG